MATAALRCLKVIVPTLSPACTSPLDLVELERLAHVAVQVEYRRAAASGSESVAFTVLSIQSACGTSATTGTSDVWPPTVIEAVCVLLASG